MLHLLSKMHVLIIYYLGPLIIFELWTPICMFSLLISVTVQLLKEIGFSSHIYTNANESTTASLKLIFRCMFRFDMPYAYYSLYQSCLHGIFVLAEHLCTHEGATPGLETSVVQPAPPNLEYSQICLLWSCLCCEETCNIPGTVQVFTEGKQNPFLFANKGFMFWIVCVRSLGSLEFVTRFKKETVISPLAVPWRHCSGN